MALHASSPFISSAKSRKNFLTSALEAFVHALIVASRSSCGSKSILLGSQLTKDSSGRQICPGDAAGPIVGPPVECWGLGTVENFAMRHSAWPRQYRDRLQRRAEVGCAVGLHDNLL